MKTVLLAAVGSLFLALAAHAADAPLSNQARASGPQAPISHEVVRSNASGPACIGGAAAVTPTAYSTDADAEGETSPCLQYLSTQTLVQQPATGRT